MRVSSLNAMPTKNLLEECLRQVFRPHARRGFLIGQLQEIGQDLARLHVATPQGVHEPALGLASCITARVVEMIDGIETRPHRLNPAAFNTLMSWFFPTEDQLHAAVAHLEEMGLCAESKMAFVSDKHPRHFLVATNDHYDRLGNRYVKGALIPLVVGDQRIEHLRLIAQAAIALQQDNVQSLEAR